MDTDYEIIKLNDGGIYHGEVNKNGLPQSSDGTCTWVGKKMSYSGGWIDGKMAGIGTLYENGKVKYRGFWWEGELIHIFGNEEPSKPQDRLPKNKNKIVALLVGCNYESGSNPLPFCVKEITEIGRKMSEIGIDVTILKNATKKEIERGLKELSSKDIKYDHALFYFSGHGTLYGSYHFLQDIVGEPMALEIDVLSEFCETKFKNIVIVHDACNVVAPITQSNIEDLYNEKRMFILNHMHARNVLYAFSSLNGNYSFASKNQLGMFALAFIENVQKRNVPVLKMFDNITRFVLDYSEKTHGVYLETPNISKTLFDDNFCLYVPEE